MNIGDHSESDWEFYRSDVLNTTTLITAHTTKVEKAMITLDMVLEDPNIWVRVRFRSSTGILSEWSDLHHYSVSPYYVGAVLPNHDIVVSVHNGKWLICAPSTKRAKTASALSWGSDSAYTSALGAISPDGRVNTTALITLLPEDGRIAEDGYRLPKAFQFCKEKGTKYFLPSKEEAMVLRANKDMINTKDLYYTDSALLFGNVSTQRWWTSSEDTTTTATTFHTATSETVLVSRARTESNHVCPVRYAPIFGEEEDEPDAVPETPVIITPTITSGSILNGAVAQCTAYFSPAGVAFHSAIWQIAEDDNFTQGLLVYPFTDNAITMVIPNIPCRPYYLRVRHVDVEGKQSDWSIPMRFTPTGMYPGAIMQNGDIVVGQYNGKWLLVAPASKRKASAVWGPNGTGFGASSTDGAANQANMGWVNPNDPRVDFRPGGGWRASEAFNWMHLAGPEYYLPSTQELDLILTNRTLIDSVDESALSTHYGLRLNDSTSGKKWWTSTAAVGSTTMALYGQVLSSEHVELQPQLRVTSSGAMPVRSLPLSTLNTVPWGPGDTGLDAMILMVTVAPNGANTGSFSASFDEVTTGSLGTYWHDMVGNITKVQFHFYSDDPIETTQAYDGDTATLGSVGATFKPMWNVTPGAAKVRFRLKTVNTDYTPWTEPVTFTAGDYAPGSITSSGNLVLCRNTWVEGHPWLLAIHPSHRYRGNDLTWGPATNVGYSFNTNSDPALYTGQTACGYMYNLIDNDFNGLANPYYDPECFWYARNYGWHLPSLYEVGYLKMAKDLLVSYDELSGFTDNCLWSWWTSTEIHLTVASRWRIAYSFRLSRLSDGTISINTFQDDRGAPLHGAMLLWLHPSTERIPAPLFYINKNSEGSISNNPSVYILPARTKQLDDFERAEVTFSPVGGGTDLTYFTSTVINTGIMENYIVLDGADVAGLSLATSYNVTVKYRVTVDGVSTLGPISKAQLYTTVGGGVSKPTASCDSAFGYLPAENAVFRLTAPITSGTIQRTEFQVSTSAGFESPNILATPQTHSGDFTYKVWHQQWPANSTLYLRGRYITSVGTSQWSDTVTLSNANSSICSPPVSMTIAPTVPFNWRYNVYLNSNWSAFPGNSGTHANTQIQFGDVATPTSYYEFTHSTHTPAVSADWWDGSMQGITTKMTIAQGAWVRARGRWQNSYGYWSTWTAWTAKYQTLTSLVPYPISPTSTGTHVSPLLVSTAQVTAGQGILAGYPPVTTSDIGNNWVTWDAYIFKVHRYSTGELMLTRVTLVSPGSQPPISKTFQDLYNSAFGGLNYEVVGIEVFVRRSIQVDGVWTYNNSASLWYYVRLVS
jgi:hypothetical protein